MIKKMFIILVVCLEAISLMNALETQKLSIAKIIDKQDATFAFIVWASQNHEKITTKFRTDYNAINLYDQQTEISQAVHKDPPLLFELANGVTFWQVSDIIEMLNRYKEKLNTRFNTLGWDMSFFYNVNGLQTKMYLWRDLQFQEFQSEFDKKNAVNLKIAKLLDGKPLSFAFIVTNDTDKPIKFPDFFTADNLLKIKFPDGKIYTAPLKDKTEKLSIVAGESRFIKFDLNELLTADKEFSPKNFEFGLSELLWEVHKPSGEIITEKFHLVKFNGELPPDNGNGYHLLAPPTPETFRDRLIEILPKVRAKITN